MWPTIEQMQFKRDATTDEKQQSAVWIIFLPLVSTGARAMSLLAVKGRAMNFYSAGMVCTFHTITLRSLSYSCCWHSGGNLSPFKQFFTETCSHAEEFQLLEVRGPRSLCGRPQAQGNMLTSLVWLRRDFSESNIFVLYPYDSFVLWAVLLVLGKVRCLTAGNITMSLLSAFRRVVAQALQVVALNVTCEQDRVKPASE